MKKSIAQKLAAAIILALAVACIGVGFYGNGLGTEKQEQVLSAMRTRALLNATGAGAVESFVAAAKKEAAAKVKAEGGTMADIREASAKAEEDARANASGSLIDYDTVDAAPLSQAALSLRAAQMEYSAEEARAQAEYVEKNKDKLVIEEPTSAESAPVDDAPPATEEGGEVAGLDDLALTTDDEPKIDLSGFQATEEMNRLQVVVDEKYQGVADALKGVYPVLDDAALTQLKPMLLDLVHTGGDTYKTEYDRLAGANGLPALGSDGAAALVMRHGSSLITVGVGLIILALLVWFYAAIVKALGIPRLIIGGFFVLLCVMSVLFDLNIASLLSNTIVRMGMNSVMVLAMVPAIQCGISLNLGLPLGIVGGLLGGLLCIELGYSGLAGFGFAVLVGLAISAVLGYLYGLLLNRLKGNEMAVTTYVGFSIVSLMCIAWLVLPFKSLVLRWPLGTGLRQTASLEPAFQFILDDFLKFNIWGITVPTGLILFMVLCCVIVWLFTRSKTGVAMAAAGNNPRFAEATGINVDRMRIIGTTFSTMLGAVGILVYSQSFGFIQLYTHPRTLGLVAASAILIGGATTSRAKISHVLIGTFLFQGVLTLGMPVANALVPGSTIAETMRILVSNGIILYALTKSGGESRA